MDNSDGMTVPEAAKWLRVHGFIEEADALLLSLAEYFRASQPLAGQTPDMTQLAMAREASDGLMTLEGAAKYLKLHPVTLRRKAGKEIPGTKIGNRWRFSRVILDQWLSERSTATLRPQRLSQSSSKPSWKSPLATGGCSKVLALIAESKRRNHAAS